MNIIKWVIEKKTIEREIEEQDKQYNDLLTKNGRLEEVIKLLKEQLETSENDRLNKVEQLGKLRRKYNDLKKEIKNDK